MYIPKHLEVTDLSQQIALIEKHPLGILFNYVAPNDSLLGYFKGSDNKIDSEMCATHVPFFFVKDDEGNQSLIAHLAGNNQQIEMLKQNPNCMVVFQSADSYVSPAWYPLKEKTHKFVPTWDFACVHVYGKAIIHQEEEWLLNMLNSITNQEENKRPEEGRPKRWKVDETDEKYLKQKLNDIVGLEIKITNIQSKFKLHQEQPPINVNGVIDGYAKELGNETGQELTELMKEHYPRQL